jgi:hypothetical protein
METPDLRRGEAFAVIARKDFLVGLVVIGEAEVVSIPNRYQTGKARRLDRQQHRFGDPVGGRKSIGSGNGWMGRICHQAERVMLAKLWIALTYPFSFFRPRHDLALEALALRHQLLVLKRQTHRPRLRRSDRYFWLLLMRVWPQWRNPLMSFQPEILIGWQPSGFSASR